MHDISDVYIPRVSNRFLKIAVGGIDTAAVLYTNYTKETRTRSNFELNGSNHTFTNRYIIMTFKIT
jgi:hypothetical protein